MKLKKVTSSIILLAALPTSSGAAAANGPHSYLVGGIIALLIMVYLIYSLLRPDKF
jgi:K+-transporting ATPase KdpF subunit